MTSTTVTPAFPGSIGDYLYPAPSWQWDAFADATLERRDDHRELGRSLARTARHRKPNRRGAAIRKAAGAALALAAVLGFAGQHAPAPHAAPAAMVQQAPSVTVSPVVDAAHGGWAVVHVRFGECVQDVKAWVTSGDDGPDNTREGQDPASQGGSVHTVRVRISAATAAQMPGSWYVGSVQGVTCSGGNPVEVYWPQPVFEVNA